MILIGSDYMHQKKCVLFDVDGTLVDTEKVTIEALKITMKELYNRDYSKNELNFAVGLPGKHTLHKLDIENIDATLRVWNEQIRKFINEVRIYPQIEETLNSLKNKNIKLGIVTSRYGFEVKEDIMLNEILHHFDLIVTYDESLRPKPYPDQLLKALKELNKNPDEAVYVGDTNYDYGCAKSCNVDFLLANWGEVDRRDNFDDKNIKICNKPLDLLDYIIGG